MTAALEPWTNALVLGESSTMRAHRYADRFSVVHVQTIGPLTDAVQKSSSVPALLVSMFVQPVAARDFRLWIDGRIVPTGKIPAFHANVIDLGAEPAMWGGRGVSYVHFHVRRSAIDDTASDLGYERLGAFRPSVVQEDLALAQITRTLLPYLSGDARPLPLALDHLELIVGAHLVQRYGAAKRRTLVGGGLATWQRRRATELLSENLDGRLRLADLARVRAVGQPLRTRIQSQLWGHKPSLADRTSGRTRTGTARAHGPPPGRRRGPIRIRGSGGVHADVPSRRRRDPGPMAA